MDILGVGPLELLFILLIALIVLGPTDMVKAGRTLGRFLRRMVMSPTWQMVQRTSRDLRNLPNTLMREAGLEDEAKLIQEQLKMDGVEAEIQDGLDEVKQVQDQAKADLTAWTTSPSIDPRKSQTGSPKKTEDQAIVDESSAPASDSTPPVAPAPAQGDGPSNPHEGDSPAESEGA